MYAKTEAKRALSKRFFRVGTAADLKLLNIHVENINVIVSGMMGQRIHAEFWWRNLVEGSRL
jgi:hypothetical protein